MLSRAVEAEVLRLHHAERWPIGTIARQLMLHHSTVRRVLAQAGVPAAQKTTRPSIADPFIPFILETLKQYPKLCASRLHVMVRERGYRGGSDHFRAIVARFRPRPVPEAYLRLRTLAGEQAQCDWAHFGTITIGKATRPLMAFVMVLSYSRHLFLRFYLNGAMNNFLRGHVEAFTAWGAVPRVVLYDNLRSAVLERRAEAIRFHPTLLELAAHYRFQPRPVAVARGNEKACVSYCLLSGTLSSDRGASCFALSDRACLHGVVQAVAIAVIVANQQARPTHFVNHSGGYTETLSEFITRQHAAIAQSLIVRLEFEDKSQIEHRRSGQRLLFPIAMAPRIELLCGFLLGVGLEQLIQLRDELRVEFTDHGDGLGALNCE